MKKNFIFFLLITNFILLIVFTSCAEKNLKYSDIAYFAEPIVQDFCAGFSGNDYNQFANFFSYYFSKPIPPETLEKVFEKIGNTIGNYKENTISYKSIEKRKNIIIVQYTASFSLEEQPVIITLNFEKIQNEFKLSGFNVDSPKLKNK